MSPYDITESFPIFFFLLLINQPSVDSEYTRLHQSINVSGYIYHPQYYNAYEILPLPPAVKHQFYVEEGDYVMGHYTLTTPEGTATTVDYAGEPTHGFHATVKGAEVHVELAKVLASTLQFGMPHDAENATDQVPHYKVPVVHGGDLGTVFVPADRHAVPSNYTPLREMVKHSGRHRGHPKKG